MSGSRPNPARRPRRPGARTLRVPAPRPAYQPIDDSPVPPPDERVAIGRINAPWGLKGHVKVTPLTANPERFTVGAVVILDGVRARIADIETPLGFPCVLFEGHDGRNAAEALRGLLIEIPESDLPPLPEGEYYTHDLIGMSVVTTTGEPVGVLEQVLVTGANDVYLVRLPDQKDVLIPALGHIVVEVDVPGKRMVIEPVKGLLSGSPEDRE